LKSRNIFSAIGHHAGHVGLIERSAPETRQTRFKSGFLSIFVKFSVTSIYIFLPPEILKLRTKWLTGVTWREIIAAWGRLKNPTLQVGCRAGAVPTQARAGFNIRPACI
jgi:hypothetical protein